MSDMPEELKDDNRAMNPEAQFLAIERKLTSQERADLSKFHWPILVELAQRYLPNIELTVGSQLEPEVPDIIRGRWLLDSSSDKPSYDKIVSGCGFAFGQVLEEQLKMGWCQILDQWGEELALVAENTAELQPNTTISFCPFSYTAKREHVQNVEVFEDAYRELQKLLNQ